MYKLISGEPIEQIKFEIIKAQRGHDRYKVFCEDIFTLDTETTSAYYDDAGNVFPFDYDNPKKCQDAHKHSLCYLWQFGINENTKYIGRELEDLVLLLRKLHKYCPFKKIIWVFNLAFDFCFLQNVLNFTEVFARTPRHPMKANVKSINSTFRCAYVLMSMSLEAWGESLNLPARKLVGKLDYHKIRTPKTPLTDDEIDYSLADLNVMYYGLKKLKEQYGGLYNIPMTHTGKARRKCAEIMKTEQGYNMKVSRLNPATLQEYVEQAHAFIGGTVLCSWLFKNRTIEDVNPWDISSSYPWILVSASMPQGHFYKCAKGKESQYMYNKNYVYIVRFVAYNIESNYNCHFISRSKAIQLKGCVSDNGRIVSAEKIELILTSVDYELFLQLYRFTDIDIISFKFSRAKPLNNKFRRYVLELYKDKTTLKGVEEKIELYQNQKGTINAMYGDFVTKIFADSIIYNNGMWSKVLLDEEHFNATKKKLDKKSRSNYKAFIQGVFVTAWARKRIWDAVLYEDMDEHIIYTDTDSLKMWNYNGDFFEKSNAEVMKRHEELKIELGVTDEDLSPLDIKGKKHPLGVWEREPHYKKFRSLGCKQYIVEYDNGDMALTCAGVSKLAVQCFKSVDDFTIDRRLTEKELLNCKDDKGHTAEKLTPYYATDYPEIIYPDGYKSKYKCGVCLMPTTFNLSMTPSDLHLLYTVVAEKLNNAYYTTKF